MARMYLYLCEEGFELLGHKGKKWGGSGLDYPTISALS